MHATSVPIAAALAPSDETIALTERGVQALDLTRTQERLPPASWLSDFVRAELDRRIARLLTTAA